MENKKLTLRSLFDGIGGFPMGGLISVIIPLWASEIEICPLRENVSDSAVHEAIYSTRRCGL